MKAKSSRTALVLIGVVMVVCAGVYTTQRAYARVPTTSPAAASATQTGPLVPKANYQFYLAQPLQFPGYASASAMLAGQLIGVEGSWATIQYTAGPSKTVYTVALNTAHLVFFYRLP
jgi:hypothetical protein